MGLLVSFTPMALMSLSCPPKVCLHWPSRMSHSLAVKSQAPEMKVLKSGDTPRDIQSPRWPANTVFCDPVSMSHRTLGKRIEVMVRKPYFLSFSTVRLCFSECTRYSLQSWWWSHCHSENGSRTGNLIKQKPKTQIHIIYFQKRDFKTGITHVKYTSYARYCPCVLQTVKE